MNDQPSGNHEPLARATRVESGNSPEIQQELAPAATDDLSPKVRKDLIADEADPAHIVPSAEGHVAFAGLSEDVRHWVRRQLDDLRTRTNGHGRAQKHTNGGDATEDVNRHQD